MEKILENCMFLDFDFSMCILSMNTVNASAKDTTAFESESKTVDTEAFTSDTENSNTEIESEPSTDQFISENEETKQETEKQILTVSR